VGTQGSILIVDDEFGLAEMLRDMLRELEYDVALAINGQLALQVLQERSVDLVITDLMMPVMDGLELGAAIRNNEALRHLPIVMMTSLPTAVPQQHHLFDAVIRKPFTPELLMRTVKECMANGSRPTGAPAGGSMTADEGHPL
jgi:CheY-like chemotaxis protein